MNDDTHRSPGRKTPIHLPIRWPGHARPIIFLTLNASQKAPILARPDVHALLLRGWTSADDWLVGDYVIMPEHLHLLCAPKNLAAPLARWLRFWKGLATRHWPRPEEKPIWQPSYWDTQLRSEDSLEEKRNYMRANPVRRGLVSHADDWPYAGRMSFLEW